MPKKNKQIRVVSLFSGCGGGDLGLCGGFNFLNKKYAKQRFNIVWANDILPFAVDTYRKNFGPHITEKDITKIKNLEIPEHDLLIGGFPCQTFSMVGKRQGFLDPRGKLYMEMVRILKVKQPPVFIAENVKGLVSVQNGDAFKKIISDFEGAGYKTYHKIINAANFGVPQKRERVIIIGIRNDIKIPFHFSLKHLSTVPLKKILEPNENIEKKYYFSERATEGLKKANKAFNKGRSQDINKPCNTISTHLAKVSLNGTDPVLLVNGKYRRFTPREAARIQSFPENFEFSGSESQQYIQIGNAIPPVMMWHIGKEVIKQIFDVKSKK